MTTAVSNGISGAGLGTMATQDANNVSITGGTINGITDLAVADGGTGVSSITANAVVLGNGTSSIQTVSPSTSGNVLTSNGTTWISAAPSAGINAQAFTSNGTFTIPSGITALKITVVGGGGSGGSSTGGGGGAGGTAISYLTGLTSGNTLSVTIGGGGGASGANGNSGGNSTVSSGTQTITTITGGGGSGGIAGGNSVGGSGGSATNGTINIIGGGGGSSIFFATSAACVFQKIGGAGGASTLSGVTRFPNTTGASNGFAGISFGGGGSGSSDSNTSGAGASGIVIFEW